MGIDKIDVEKLRALNIPEEVIASLDIRNGGNIDDEGNVLFLDEDRQKRKEHPEKPMWKDRPDGLGVKNALFKKISDNATKPKEGGGNAVFPILANAVLGKESLKKTIIMNMLGYGKKGYTYSTMLPLNVEFTDEMNTGVLPIQLIFEALEEAKYIAVVNTCICRESFRCKDYPIDIGCIFMNSAGERVVEAGVAKRVTVEEAKQHVLRAKECGLLGNSEFMQGEQPVWGLKNSQMHEFRMICLCCPCCCFNMKVLKGGTPDNRARHVSCGYTSTINHTKCVGCQKCAPACPQQAITYREDGKAVVNQEVCMGCGWCALECENDAIHIKQTFPMRKSLNEYFLKEARVDDGLEHKR